MENRNKFIPTTGGEAGILDYGRGGINKIFKQNPEVQGPWTRWPDVNEIFWILQIIFKQKFGILDYC